MFVLIGVAALMMLLGILIRRYKCYWLISGYNTMSKEKKQKVDIEAMGNFMGKMLYLMAGIFLASGLLGLAGYSNLALAGTLLIFPVTIYLLIKAQDFDQNSKNPDGSYKLHVKLLIGFMILVTCGIGVLIYTSAQPAQIAVTDGYLEIKGMYGRQINWGDIEKVTLDEKMPKILSRTNGSSIGDFKKGHFRIEERGRALLFIINNKPPYIFIEREQGLIIINKGDREETIELYNQIRQHID